MTPRKIDKSHGFMQSIIKNQVLRDEFDKEQKVLTTTKKNEEMVKSDRLTGVAAKETRKNRTSKREPKQLYVPPHLKRRGTTEDDGQTAPKTSDPPQEVKRKRISQKDEKSRVLFKFEYEGDDGEVRSILVREDDNAEDLAETFGNQLGLTKSLRKALQHRLEEEIESCINS